VRYGYDGFGDLVSVTRPDASVVGYDYKHITDGVSFTQTTSSFASASPRGGFWKMIMTISGA